MTPTEIKNRRKTLGLSARRFALLLGVAGDRTVRRWERGDMDVPRHAVLLLRAMDEVPGMRKFLSDANDLGLTA